MIEYRPADRDWTKKELKELFSFNTGLATPDKNAVYYGELITLYNPNILRHTIETIPEHSNEGPEEMTKAELDEMKKLLAPDSTLMANPFLIKKIKLPEQ